MNFNNGGSSLSMTGGGSNGGSEDVSTVADRITNIENNINTFVSNTLPHFIRDNGSNPVLVNTVLNFNQANTFRTDQTFNDGVFFNGSTNFNGYANFNGQIKTKKDAIERESIRGLETDLNLLQLNDMKMFTDITNNTNDLNRLEVYIDSTNSQLNNTNARVDSAIADIGRHTNTIDANKNLLAEHTTEIISMQTDITKIKTIDRLTLTDECIQSSHLAKNINIITTGNITCNTATVKTLNCPEYDARFTDTNQNITTSAANIIKTIDTATDTLYKQIIQPRVNICIVATGIPNDGDIYNGRLSFFPIHGFPNDFEYKYPTSFKIHSFILNDEQPTLTWIQMTLTFQRKESLGMFENYDYSSDTAKVDFFNFTIGFENDIHFNRINYLTTPYSVPIKSRLSVSYSYKLIAMSANGGFGPQRTLPPRFLIYGYIDEE